MLYFTLLADDAEVLAHWRGNQPTTGGKSRPAAKRAQYLGSRRLDVQQRYGVGKVWLGRDRVLWPPGGVAIDPKKLRRCHSVVPRHR